jgi:NAD-dependent dihydropyrimidine dehydrogenase PreA subunit
MGTPDKADCRHEAGTIKPIIDRHLCEGKEDCVRVCPYHVFEVRKLSAQELGELPFFARLKVRVHGSKQAFAVRADACHGCGLCVTSCPEKAIKLQR